MSEITKQRDSKKMSRWGALGGKARAKTMSKKERSAHARKMALARWRKYQNNGNKQEVK